MRKVKYTLNSGKCLKYELAEWTPEGYVIITPAGNQADRKSAQLLADFYKDKGFDLTVADDTAPETEKEILVGETSRIQREKALKEGMVLSCFEGEKLLITGGHYVTVNSAVQRFIRLCKEEFIPLFSENTDFQSVKPGGYQYVWGDEFEGTEFDLTKWCFEARMGGTEEIKVAYDKDVIKMYDGHATLRAMSYSDPEDPKVKYKVPRSLCTLFTMNYDYGYAEIRAKVPYSTGAWPSFWATTACNISGKRNMQWHGEIDCFEVFGSHFKAIPNIHKWYDQFDYNTVYETGTTQKAHFQYPEYRKPLWEWENIDTINDEWHTYGFEKTETAVNFYIDGKYYGYCDIVNTFDEHEDMSVFQDPIYLIMNNHVFADDSGFRPNLISDVLGRLPSDYHIDWVRLYMKPDKGTIYLDETPGDYPLRKV